MVVLNRQLAWVLSDSLSTSATLLKIRGTQMTSSTGVSHPLTDW